MRDEHHHDGCGSQAIQLRDTLHGLELLFRGARSRGSMQLESL